MWTRPKRTVPPDIFQSIRRIAHPDYLRERQPLRIFFANFEPILLGDVLVTETGSFDLTSSGRRTIYRDESGLGYEMVAHQWMDGTVRVDLNAGTVSKTVGGTYRHLGVLERELNWLERLQGSGIVPELVSSSANGFVTRYVGEPASLYNLPFDWKEQAEGILAQLASHGCAHNDIAAGNLVIGDGRIRLIDFAWSLPIGAPIPSDWPIELGRHNLGTHSFDDRHAIYEALAEKEADSRAVAAGAPVPKPRTPSAPLR